MTKINENITETSKTVVSKIKGKETIFSAVYFTCYHNPIQRQMVWMMNWTG
jgi:hypothetical protein